MEPNCRISSTGVPDPVDRRDLQDAGVAEIDDSVVLVLLQQGVEHGTGLRAVLGEDVPLADVLGPLAASQRRAAVGDMADQVERVEVRVDFVGERLEAQALLFQLVDDRLLAVGCLPALEERVERREVVRAPLASSSREGSR